MLSLSSVSVVKNKGCAIQGQPVLQARPWQCERSLNVRIERKLEKSTLAVPDAREDSLIAELETQLSTDEESVPIPSLASIFKEK